MRKPIIAVTMGDPSGIGPEIILKALEKDIDLRYQSAAEMRGDLRRIQRDSESAIALPTAAAKKKWPRPLIAGAAVLVLLVIAGAGAVLYWVARSPSSSRTGPISERQLTANPAETPVYSAAISADGEHLAYSDETGFYVRVLSTGENDSLKLPPGFCFR